MHLVAWWDAHATQASCSKFPRLCTPVMRPGDDSRGRQAEIDQEQVGRCAQGDCIINFLPSQQDIMFPRRHELL